MPLTEEQKKYQREWYHDNVDTIRPKKTARDAKQRKFLRRISDEVKLIFGCKHCGFDKHPRALQFHHRDSDEKEFAIGNMTSGMSLLKFLSEISKCDVLCANCHLIHHA